MEPSASPQRSWLQTRDRHRNLPDCERRTITWRAPVAQQRMDDAMPITWLPLCIQLVRPNYDESKVAAPEPAAPHVRRAPSTSTTHRTWPNREAAGRSNYDERREARRGCQARRARSPDLWLSAPSCAWRGQFQSARSLRPRLCAPVERGGRLRNMAASLARVCAKDCLDIHKHCTLTSWHIIDDQALAST